MKRILVVDDEQSMRELLAIMLKKEGFEVLTAESRAVAAAVLGQGPVDLVITAFGSTETAVAALKLGAHDYLLKPFDVDELKIVVRNALESQELREENLRLKKELGRRHGLEQVIGVSPPMVALFDMVRSIAPTSSTVLITGDSGTGKELVARAIHALSTRKDGPFVSINCGALPDTLLESELFGHMKGAFTDAHQTKKGLFEAAHRGTLFLDEVGETSAAMQVKLLRALQERTIRRVGGTAEVEVDVRVISATNVPLDSLVRERRFREDLYYRLQVIPIRTPPLRERREDIPLLAEHFRLRFTEQMGKHVVKFSEAALAILMRHPWPGNVRELENVVERAVALETTEAILPERLSESVSPSVAPAIPAGDLGPGFNLDEHILTIEGRLLMQALEHANGDRAEAARILGVSPRSLRYLIQKHAVTVGRS
jgi:two-component system response regulator PilR (NtrC family)